MNRPDLRICKTPRLLQRYLAMMARKISGEQGVVDIFYVGDIVFVLDEDGEYRGVIREVLDGGFYEVDFDDGDDGCYGAEDFYRR